MNTDTKYIDQLIDQCEKLSRQCEESKLKSPEPPKTSSPTKEQQQQKGFYPLKKLSKF
jgi:hypothetical protein